MKALTISGSKSNPEALNNSRMAWDLVLAQNSVLGLMIVS